MRNLVKTAAAVAVAMALSTAANAVDNISEQITAQNIQELLPAGSEKLPTLNNELNNAKLKEDKAVSTYQTKKTEADNLKKYEKRKVQLQKDFDTAKKNIKNASDKLISTQKEINAYRQDLASTPALKKLNETVTEKQNAVNSANQELDTFNKQFAKTQERANEAQKTLNSFEEILKKNNLTPEKLPKGEKLQYDTFKKAAQKYSEELTKQNKEQAQKKLTLKNAQKALDIAKLEFEKATQSNTKINDKIADLENQKQQTRESLVHYNSAKKDAQNSLNEVDDKISFSKVAQKELPEVEKAMNEAKATTSDIQKQKEQLVSDIKLVGHKELETRVAQAEGKTEELVKNLDQKIETNKKDVDNRLAEKVDTKAMTDALAEKVDKVEQDKVNENQAKVNDKYKLVLDGHEVRITNNAQRIDIQGKKFDKELKDHDARITHNAVSVKELQAAIFEGNDELTAAAHKVAAEKEKLEAMKAQAKEKGTKGATLAVTKPSANDIKAQQAKYDAAVEKMHDLSPVSRKEVKANIINLAMATQNVSQALQSNIDANKAAIAHNTQAIESNSRRIHNLDKREQRHMAQNAALAGLFQPYSIGRLNVTAAMGQYRSNNAIAVGAGYRFDNNLAVKAGFSMSTNAADDAAYNVGVNYEF